VCSSDLGFSPLKGGWNDLFKKLKKFQRGFALDESQYDSSLRAYLMWNCAEFRWKMLRAEDQTEDNYNRLRNYYRNLINTLILTSEGVFVMKLGGNPSGSVNTITDNTLILYVLLAFAWVMNAPEEKRTYEAFEAYTSKALVGDDNTFTVSEEAIGFFNAKSIIPTWAEIGITTTTDSLEPRPVEELDFLSAHTVFVDGCAVPLYARDKLLTSLLYSRFPNDPAYTLTRATALQRVAWADVPMRNYLQEFVSWLIEEYDHVLYDEPTWKMAKNQIPLDQELKALFLGKERLPLLNQSCLCGKLERYNSRIKSSDQMFGQVARAQRPRGRQPRQPRKKAQFARVGALAVPLPLNQTRGKGRGGRRRRNRGGNNGRKTDFSGVRARGPNGLRPGKRRHNFSEDEFIEDILGSTTYGEGALTTAKQFAVNPGQAAVFPWLAQIAARYEKYVFTMLEFYYKHEVSQFATAGTTGKVIYSFDYDAADAPPTSKQQQMDSDPHSDKMPCEDFVLRVDCREAFGNGPKYVRPGNLPGGADVKTYDCGLLNVGCSGTTDNTTKLGELHVRYAGYFEKPVLESTSSVPVNNQVSIFTDTAQTLSTGVSTTLLLPNASFNGLSAVNTSGSIVLPAGNYMVDAIVECVDTANEVFAGQLLIKVGGVTVSGNAAVFATAAAASNKNQLIQKWMVQSNGSSALTIVVALTGAAGTLTAAGTVYIVAV